ncbi:uncharacterized protein LOC126253560 [Schistocerca nitens]|uniref:uncharacterized protein LOC126253560 n=1 Tax=Schistocerca nitens TaxID=7011 RepID=UPI002117B9B1|nr:uncharacterized protein LOC126253560 [Schistocerca nitens]XP_049810927.1 uncharacterized protein LOC126253560 [Schistocerca nitens]
MVLRENPMLRQSWMLYPSDEPLRDQGASEGTLPTSCRVILSSQASLDVDTEGMWTWRGMWSAHGSPDCTLVYETRPTTSQSRNFSVCLTAAECTPLANSASQTRWSPIQGLAQPDSAKLR